MFYDSDLLWERGCLSHVISVVLTLLAIVFLATGINTTWAWLLLVGEAINVILYIVYRRISKHKYYREASFWLRKDDDEEESSNTNQ